MKRKFFNFVLAVCILPFSMAYASGIQVGKYTFNEKGHGGEIVIAPAQGSQGVFTLLAETYNTATINVCSYSGTCVSQGESLLCTNADAPEVTIMVHPAPHGIRLEGEGAYAFCGNNAFFTGSYVSEVKAVAIDSGVKEEVLEFLGHEKDIKKCGSLFANNLDDYACLAFRRIGHAGSEIYMWREFALLSEPTKRADLLVAYRASVKGNIYYAAMANPRIAPMERAEVIFLGEDAEAPHGGAFVFEDARGHEFYLTCWEDFCPELLPYKGKSMEVIYQDEYYYHEGGENYMEDTFVRGYKLLSQ